MEISTVNGSADPSKLKVVSVEIVHVGKAIYLDGNETANLTYYTEESM